MFRREFVLGAGALVFLSSEALAQENARSATKAKILKTRMQKTRGYSYKVVRDPTGSAPTAKVERFELRGGDCDPGECKARPLNGRMVTRARTEKILVTDVRDGQEGWFKYSVFFPSNEFKFVESVGSTFGQILTRPSISSSDSFPIFSLDTEGEVGSKRVYIQLVEAEASEGRSSTKSEKQFTVGTFGSSGFPTNRWIDVQVYFKLSSGRDGFIEPSVGGRAFGRFEGRTQVPGGYLEVRYGIYQTGTNQFTQAHGGSIKSIPTQVVYFSNVRVLKV